MSLTLVFQMTLQKDNKGKQGRKREVKITIFQENIIVNTLFSVICVVVKVWLMGFLLNFPF